jgi:uncharacterized membrane protein
MTLLIAGLLVFLGAHLVRVIAPDFRAAMIVKLGPLGWRGVYSLVSLAGFVMLAVGYATVRWTSPMLWGPPAPALRMVVGLAMVPALILFLAAYVPGRIRAAVRHPMMIGTLVWAAAHLLVNGRVADLLLFGGFLAWALVVTTASFRRPWTPPARQPSLLWDAVAVLAGLGAWWWLAFGGGHVLLFRMPVM